VKEKRYNLFISDKLTPGPTYLGYLKMFPGSFTKREFIEATGMNEKRWRSFRSCNLQNWYDPKEEDPFEDYRGELYFPDHGKNLITGMWDSERPDPISKSMAKIKLEKHKSRFK